jgi:VWFA-related protein
MGPFQQQDQPQPQPPPPIFRAEHNEVEVVVTVRDRSGEPVSNLRQSEFEIRDNGKVQTISSFALQNATPQLAPSPTAAPSAGIQTAPRRFVALFFDDALTEPGEFARVQKAAGQFVEKSLGPEDRVAIFKASESGEVTFTNDKPKLLAAIDGLRAHPSNNTTTMTQCPESRITKPT